MQGIDNKPNDLKNRTSDDVGYDNSNGHDNEIAEENDLSSSARPRRKSWASGRVLTGTQRARKRELDRLSSRQRRQTHKERIQQLEKQVQALLENASTRKPIQSYNYDTLAAPYISNVYPYSTGSNVYHGPQKSAFQFNQSPPVIMQSSSGYHGRSYESSIETADSMNDHLHSSEEFPTSQLNVAGDYVLPHSKAPENYPLAFSPPPLDDSQPSPNSDDSPEIQISRISNGPPPLLEGSADGSTSIAQSFNKLLHQAHRLRPNQICLDDRINQHAIIAAVIQGWDSIAIHGKTCPLWDVLRHIDNRVFCMSSITTRLAMLRMIHYMLICQVRADNFRGLPPWYRPRPVQRKFQHEVVKDYFAWPGLRERLVLSDETILTDSFFETFAQCFRLNWGHTDLDTHLWDNNAGVFRFSGVFMNYLHHIHHWRMDYAFFEAYPDIYEDIEPAEPIVPIVNLAAINTSPARLIADTAENEPPEDKVSHAKDLNSISKSRHELYMESFASWAKPWSGNGQDPVPFQSAGGSSTDGWPPRGIDMMHIAR